MQAVTWNELDTFIEGLKVDPDARQKVLKSIEDFKGMGINRVDAAAIARMTTVLVLQPGVPPQDRHLKITDLLALVGKAARNPTHAGALAHGLAYSTNVLIGEVLQDKGDKVSPWLAELDLLVQETGNPLYGHLLARGLVQGFVSVITGKLSKLDDLVKTAKKTAPALRVVLMPVVQATTAYYLEREDLESLSHIKEICVRNGEDRLLSAFDTAVEEDNKAAIRAENFEHLFKINPHLGVRLDAAMQASVKSGSVDQFSQLYSFMMAREATSARTILVGACKKHFGPGFTQQFIALADAVESLDPDAYKAMKGVVREHVETLLRLTSRYQSAEHSHFTQLADLFEGFRERPDLAAGLKGHYGQVQEVLSNTGLMSETNRCLAKAAQKRINYVVSEWASQDATWAMALRNAETSLPPSQRVQVPTL